MINFDKVIKITSGKRPKEREEVKQNNHIYPLVGASSIMGYTTEYNFDDYFENHHISEFEYKIYFKSHMKEIYPIAHKEIKKYYKNKGGFVGWN